MKKIITTKFDALGTDFHIENGLVIAGETIHTSRSGLSGTLRHYVGAGDVIPAYRRDAIPDNFPDRFAVFSGHGSAPEKIWILEAEADWEWSARPIINGRVDDGRFGGQYTYHVPWWVNPDFELGAIRFEGRNCPYLAQVSWAIWRRRLSLIGGSWLYDYRGLPVAYEVFTNGTDRAPFVHVCPGVIAGVDSKKDEGVLISEDHGVLGTVYDWSQAVDAWHLRVSEGETPSDLIKEMAEAHRLGFEKPAPVQGPVVEMVST